MHLFKICGHKHTCTLPKCNSAGVVLAQACPNEPGKIIGCFNIKQPPLQGDYDEEEYERVAKRPRASEFIHEEAGMYVCELICLHVCVVRMCTHVQVRVSVCCVCIMCASWCACVYVCMCCVVHVCVCTLVLQKSTHWQSDLQVYQREEGLVVTFSNVYAFSHERTPMYVCRDSMSSHPSPQPMLTACSNNIQWSQSPKLVS